MKLKFKTQSYQTAAVQAVVDCFAGQPSQGSVRYRLAPGVKPETKPAEPQAALFAEEVSAVDRLPQRRYRPAARQAAGEYPAGAALAEPASPPPTEPATTRFTGWMPWTPTTRNW
ncbi:hypothetical protein [Microbulbifer sp.]|uniref:hypothetical protein n=1 Tax=Microbulbifer sp. TaxID=1908541 RepID=UPI003F4028F0